MVFLSSVHIPLSATYITTILLELEIAWDIWLSVDEDVLLSR